MNDQLSIQDQVSRDLATMLVFGKLVDNVRGELIRDKCDFIAGVLCAKYAIENDAP